MELSRSEGELVLQTGVYRLIFHTQRPFVDLETSGGERVAELFVFSSVHPLNGRDDTYQTGAWTVEEAPDEITVSIRAKSTAWKAKTYHFRCREQRLTYSIEVEGRGALAEAHYFGGYYSESLRWGSGFFWSGQRFARVFNPEPNIPETFHLPPEANTKIDLTGVPIPARGDWFFTPPPFCFAGQVASGWLTLGVEARPGANTFTEYGFHGSLGAFYLTLSYERHTHVRDTYQLPAIGFDFAADEYAAVAAHVTALREAGYAPVPQRESTPAWWRTPIFCGWGAQCHLASVDQGRAPDYARQEHYEQFMATLTEHGINPGIIVLDDKWQATYGDNAVDEAKWPDLRGFIDRQHEAGRKVLLWLKAWDPEGLPDDECISNAGGAPIAADPTFPMYENRLRSAVRRMLGQDGYNADGFKIDFTARIPSGYGLRLLDDGVWGLGWLDRLSRRFGWNLRLYREGVWGLELMRAYLSILYTEAKLVKPDALIMSHTPHPYLADVLDMIRLNDINTGQDVNRAMRHRAKIASIACPEAIIDTDNWPITDKAAWRAYLQIQPDLGVPSLYCVTHIDTTGEPLDEDDYALIRQIWARAKERKD